MNRFDFLIRPFRVGLLLALLVPLLASAQDNPPGPNSALVVVFNRRIVVLRATTFGNTPEQRAQANHQRIAEILAADNNLTVTTQSRAEGTAILIDGEFMMTITPGDVDPTTGETLEQTVATAVRQLDMALTAAREQRSIPYLLRAAAKTLAAAVFYVTILWCSRRSLRWLWAQVRRWPQLTGQSMWGSAQPLLPQLLVVYQWIVRLIFWVVVIVVTDVWITFSLNQFPYTAPWGEKLTQHLFVIAATLSRGVINALPGLLVVGVILVATRIVTKLVRIFFANVRDRRFTVGWLDPEGARPTGRIVTVIIWAFAAVMIYPYLPGSGSLAFKGVSVFLGLLLSLGGSGVISQVMGGFVLMYSRALKAGDYVRIGDHEGTVAALSFLSTRLRTNRNEEINIPNSVLVSATTVNYSRAAGTDGLRLPTTITIGYDAPWRQVHALLVAAAEKTPGLLQSPAPFVYQRALADFYVQYELNAYLEQPDQRLAVLAALHANIQDEFNAAGVQIMSPHFIANPPEKVLVPKDKWQPPPAT